MIKHSLLTFCVAFLFGIFFFASQSTSSLLDRRDDSFELRKRVDLNTLYNAVPSKNKVALGGAKDFEIDLKKSATYTTAYFYGCTVVINVDGQGLTIGHFAQEQPRPGTNGQASCIAMTDRTVVEDKIIDGLREAVIMRDYTADTRAWIITSSGTGTVGYSLIHEYFEENGMLAKNIIPYAYTAMSAFSNFQNGPIGKAVVEIVPKGDGSGTTVNVYIQSDAPSWSGNYDRDGKLVLT